MIILLLFIFITLYPYCIFSSRDIQLEGYCNTKDKGGNGFNHYVRSVGTDLVVNKEVTVSVMDGGEGKRSLMGKRHVDDYPGARRKFRYTGEKDEDVGISFLPALLKFDNIPLCQTSTQSVTVFNHGDDDLVVLSVHTDGIQFYSCSFKDIVIQPQTQADINIDFIPKSEGSVKNTITISTTRGSFLYEVTGQGSRSPYRISPLSYVVSQNYHIERAISIFNPHNHVLKIAEIYATGGFLNLVLPSQSESLWDIEPGISKDIIKFFFCGENWGKYKSTIFVKTLDNTEFNIQVEITLSKDEIFINEEMDFGTITSLKDSITAHLSILNTGTSKVSISQINNPSNVISTVPLRENIEAGDDVVFADFIFNPIESGKISGKITIHVSKGSNTPDIIKEVKYRANVVLGRIEYFKNLYFPIDTITDKKIGVLNHFAYPIAISGAFTTDSRFTFINNLPKLLSPEELWDDIIVVYNPNNDYFPDLNPSVTFFTNVTQFIVPLYLYQGKVSYSIQKEDLDPIKNLNFGDVLVNETSSLILTLKNENPVELPVQIKNVGSIEVHLDSLWNSKNYEVVLDSSINDNDTIVLEPGYSLKYLISVSPNIESQYNGYLTIKSSYENMKIETTYNAILGSIQFFPDKIFVNPFILKDDDIEIYAKNMFSQTVTINSILSDGFEIKLLESELPPGKKIKFAKLALTDHDIYDSEQYDYIKKGDFKNANYETLSKFSQFLQLGKNTFSIKIESSFASYSIPLVFAKKESVLGERELDFGITQTHTSNTKFITILNPLSDPLEMEIIYLRGESSEFLVADASKKLVIDPFSKIESPVTFHPDHYENFTGSLYLKNNYTVLEKITFSGRGGYGSLHFDINTDYLDIENFEVKPFGVINFTIENLGDENLDVDALYIAGHLCEANGFMLSPCESMTLLPSQKHIISITKKSNRVSKITEQIIEIKSKRELYSFPLSALAVHPKEKDYATLTVFIILSFIFSALIGFFLVQNNIKREIQKKLERYKLPIKESDECILKDEILKEKTYPVPGPIVDEDHEHLQEIERIIEKIDKIPKSDGVKLLQKETEIVEIVQRILDDPNAEKEDTEEIEEKEQIKLKAVRPTVTNPQKENIKPPKKNIKKKKNKAPIQKKQVEKQRKPVIPDITPVKPLVVPVQKKPIEKQSKTSQKTQKKSNFYFSDEMPPKPKKIELKKEKVKEKEKEKILRPLRQKERNSISPEKTKKERPIQEKPKRFRIKNKQTTQKPEELQSVGVIGEMKNMIERRGAEDSYFSDSSSDIQTVHPIALWEGPSRRSQPGFALFYSNEFDPFVLDL